MSKPPGGPGRGRRLVGWVLILMAVANLAANGLWLHTGDIHRPGHHFIMRGGWPGFWITSVLAVVALVAGAFLLVRDWRRRGDGASR